MKQQTLFSTQPNTNRKRKSPSSQSPPPKKQKSSGSCEIVSVCASSANSMKYSYLANILENISQTSSRIEITKLLADGFTELISQNLDDLVPAIYLCTGKIAPAHVGIELGVGDALLIKSIAEVSGKTPQAIKKMYQEQGDLGTVAQTAKSSQKTLFGNLHQTKTLSIQSVIAELRSIASTTGKKSIDVKSRKIKSLLISSTGIETKFIVRTLQEKLRIHLGEETVLSALAHSLASINPNFNKSKSTDKSKTAKSKSAGRVEMKQAETILKQAFSELPCYEKIVDAWNNGGRTMNAIENDCHVIVGIPIRPMLSKPAKSVDEVLEKFEEQTLTCEYKYDGERQQIHVATDSDGNVQIKLYSRNLENTTGKFPDMIEAVRESINSLGGLVESAIIDCEVVAFDPQEQKIKSFQSLSTRGRKDIKLENIKVSVCLFVFDMLYLNGESLLHQSLEIRKQKLISSFGQVEGKFYFAKELQLPTSTQKLKTRKLEIANFLRESIEAGCEGLIIKTSVAYEPAARTTNWTKVKKDYLDGMGDSLDLVPIGAYFGKGKRTGVYGGFLLACFDSETECYQTVCKIGTGFSDEQFQQFSNSLNLHKITKPKSYYSLGTLSKMPDVWFDAIQVWEVSTADLTISPIYTAAVGLVHPHKGIALRFPRLVRVREDKKPEEATTSIQVAELFNKQNNV